MLCLALGFVAGPMLADSPSRVVVVDLLAVYTDAAAVGAGGRGQLLAQIAESVNEANQVFQNSRAQVCIRLVGSLPVNYQESGSVSNDLARLQIPDDGALDEVHSERDVHRADLVCLITETGTDLWFSGLQGPSARNAFSVLRRPFLVGGLFLPVTLSFNFGCQLERPFADSVGAFPDAHGFSLRAQDGQLYSTVEGFSYRRLPVFSNPSLSHYYTSLGVRLGLPDPADNARVLRTVAPILSGFRGTPLSTLPPAIRWLKPGPGAELVWSPTIDYEFEAVDEDGLLTRREIRVDGQRTPTSQRSATVLQGACPEVGRHSVVAVVTDDMGAQSFSEPVTFIVRPLNDAFTNRLTLAGERLTVDASLAFATREPMEPDIPGARGQASIWWEWTAPRDGQVNVQLTQPTLPADCATRIFAVYSGHALPELTLQASVTNASAYKNLVFPVAQGIRYAIKMDAAVGTGFVDCGTPPGELAIRMVDSQLATPEEGQSWIAPAEVPIAVQISAADGDVSRVDYYANELHLGTTFHVPHSLSWPDVPLGSYAIQAAITGQDGKTVFLPARNIRVRQVNDDFENRLQLDCVGCEFTGSTQGASRQPEERAFGAGHTLWWSWTAPADGLFRLFLSGTELPLNSRIYKGQSLGALRQVGGTDLNTVWPAGVPVREGQTYQIAIDSNDERVGPFTASITFTDLLVNDFLENRIRLSGEDARIQVNPDRATSDPDLPEDQAGLWYSWTAPHDGLLRVSQPAPQGPSLCRVLVVDDNDSLQELGYLSSSWGYREGYFRVWEGQEYLLQVSGTVPTELTVAFAREGTNDLFVDRSRLQGWGTRVRAANTTAHPEVNEPPHAGEPSSRSLWWSWTAPESGRAKLELQTWNFAPRVAIYQGTGLSNLIGIAARFGPEPIEFEIRAGETYEIAVDSPGGSAGSMLGFFEFALNRVPLPPVPLNDLWMNASELVGMEFLLQANTWGAAREPAEPNHSEYRGTGSIWFKWQPPQSGPVWIRRRAGSLAGALVFYLGNSVSSLTRVAELQSTSETTRFTVRSSETYFIAVEGDYGSAGRSEYDVVLSGASLRSPEDGDHRIVGSVMGIEFAALPEEIDFQEVQFYRNDLKVGACSQPPWTLAITNDKQGGFRFHALGIDSFGHLRYTPVVSITVTPTNDSFAHRLVLQGARVSLTTSAKGATLEAGEPPFDPLTAAPTIWWSWTAPRSGDVLINHRSSLLSAASSLFVGSELRTLEPVPELSRPADPTFPLVASVQAGQTYQVRVQDASAWWPYGESLLTLNLFMRSSDDAFSSSTRLEGSTATWQSHTYFATSEAGEPFPASWVGQEPGSVWATWTAPAAGDVRLYPQSAWAPGSQHLGIYRGSSISKLVRVAEQMSSDFPQEGLLFRCIGGETYHFRIAHLSPRAVENPQEFRLGLSLYQSPINDDFAHRIPLTGLQVQGVGATAHSTAEAGETSPEGQPLLRSVWWSWIPEIAGRTALSVAPASGRRVTVYRGSRLTELQPVPTDHALPMGELYSNELLHFSAEPGVPYSFAVTDDADDLGPFVLKLSQTPCELTDPLSNEVFSTTQALTFRARLQNGARAPKEARFRVFDGRGVELWSGLAGMPEISAVWPAPAPGELRAAVQCTDDEGRVSLSNPVPFTVVLANDTFDQATPLAGFSGSIQGYNFGAGREPEERLLDGSMGQTVWWSWTAPASGEVQIIDTGSQIYPAMGPWLIFGASTAPPMVAVYQGASWPGLTLIASNTFVRMEPGMDLPLGVDYLVGTRSSCRFRAEAGTTYHVAVDALYGAWMTIKLGFAMTQLWMREPAQGVRMVRPPFLPLRSGIIEGDSPVSEVRYYADGELISTSINRPFDGEWVEPPLGQHVISAQMTDFLGTTHTSSPVVIQVTLPNDDFIRRIPVLGDSATLEGDNLLATCEPSESGLVGLPTGVGACRTLWWTWTAPGNGLLRMEPITEPSWCLFSIFRGETLETLDRLAHNGFVRCLGLCGCLPYLRPEIELTVTNGQVCQIALDTLNDSVVGPVGARLSFRAAPANDRFDSRLRLAGDLIQLNAANWTATLEPGEPNYGVSDAARSVWYEWTAQRTGRVRMDIQARESQSEAGLGSELGISAPDIQLASIEISTTLPGPCSYVYEVPPLPPTPSPWAAVFQGDSLGTLAPVAAGSNFLFNATAGTTYSVALLLNGTGAADTTLKLSFAPPAPNDVFTERLPLVTNEAQEFETGTAASLEAGERLDPYWGISGSLWWSWRAPGSGMARITESGARVVGVSIGSQVSDLMWVAMGQGSVEFYAHVGTTYQILVGHSEWVPGRSSLLCSMDRLPPVLSAISPAPASDGKYWVRVEGLLGQAFGLQTSTNLIDWQTLQVDTLQSAVMRLNLVRMPEDSHRFYRLATLEEVLSGAGPPTLAMSVLADGRTVNLAIRGDIGTPYRVRASSDLAEWTEIGRGILADEVWPLPEPIRSNLPWRFFTVEPFR